MKIMIVDDDKFTRVLLEDILRGEGYQDIITADSAKMATTLLGINDNSPQFVTPDLILLDVIMPDVDGIQTCSMINGLDNYRDVPIIIVTGITEKDSLRKAFEAGAMDYITKPFNSVELLARVRSALKLKSEIDRRKTREAELLHVTQLLEEVVTRLEQSSSTDGLTGLANRRSFDERLSKEFQRSLRINFEKNNEVTLSLIILDVDQFKRFNDNYGHVEGDHCLQKVAHVLANEAKRPGDFVARYGGEEFVILLPETTLEDAFIIAERIRIAVENVHIPHKHSDVSPYVTISLGVASLVTSEQLPVETLIESADHALYQAKAGGRNQTRAFSEK